METIDKEIANISQVRNEYKVLQKCKVSNYTGYLKDFILMVNITTPKGKPYLIRYSIKGKWLYYKFRKCLQRLTNRGGF